jgi:hypothetical protein
MSNEALLSSYWVWKFRRPSFLSPCGRAGSASDLSSQGGRLQHVSQRTCGIEQLALDLRRDRVPLHDDCRSKTWPLEIKYHIRQGIDPDKDPIVMDQPDGSRL